MALDLATAVVMTRLTRRTLQRRIRHERLWNGNVEPPLRTILTDPEHVIRWGWRTRDTVGGRVEHALATRPDLPVVVLHRPREVSAWLAGPVAVAAAWPV